MNKKSLLSVVIAGMAFILASCTLTPSTSASLSSETSLSSENLSENSSVASSGTSTTTSTTTSVASSSSTATSVSSSSSALRVFTLTELALYNGDNGSDAYIAVSWVVYDVTHAAQWSNGWHKNMHLAGTDCTAAFNDQHARSYLSGLTIVGSLAH